MVPAHMVILGGLNCHHHHRPHSSGEEIEARGLLWWASGQEFPVKGMWI